jgi:hypothetical protein
MEELVSIKKDCEETLIKKSFMSVKSIQCGQKNPTAFSVGASSSVLK